MTTSEYPVDLPEILLFAKQLALDAGRMMMSGSNELTTEDVGNKTNVVDLCTRWDKSIERFCIERTREEYPDFGFMGEESYVTGDVVDHKPTFIIDPIDGTTNFTKTFPFCCISIGLTIGARPVLGVIHAPFLNWTYSAAKGLGAYMEDFNGIQKLPLAAPRPLTGLRGALIGMEWGHNRTADVVFKKTAALAKLVGDPSSVPGGVLGGSVRAVGSSALNLCLIARGSLDIWYDDGTWPWDVCAGIIIVQESGGSIFGGPKSGLSGECTPEVLVGRKYCAVRAQSAPPGSTSLELAKKITSQLYTVIY